MKKPDTALRDSIIAKSVTTKLGPRTPRPDIPDRPTNIKHFELRYEKHFADIWINERVMSVPIIVARGFGKEMVSKIEQIAEKKKCKRIEFSTVINVKLINILEKRGYKYNPCIMEADNPRNLFKETITGWTKEVEDE